MRHFISGKEAKAGWFLVLAFSLVPAPVAPAATVTVGGFTSADVQAAITSAASGDIVFLPAGVYDFATTVTVSKAVTIRGAGVLQNVGVVEYGPYITANVSPVWNGTPSDCYASDSTLTRLFTVTSPGGVVFENLKITGRTTMTGGANYGIYSAGYDSITVIGCELSYCARSICLMNSYQNLIRGCYIHHNNLSGTGYGISLTGTSMETGGAQATIRENEFMADRHDVATNSPLTSFIIYKNYTHDDDDGAHQPCFEAHPQGMSTLRGVVRDNIFVRTRPLSYKCGSLEISGNYYDATCGNYDWANGGFGYSSQLGFGEPTHNSVFIPGSELHDIYVSGNTNNSGRTEVVVSTYTNADAPYNGVTKYVAYNLYYNGVLWEASHTTYPPRGESPRPLLGDIYVTTAGTTARVDTIETNTWYDLHAMACDPQGAGDIRKIGVQLRNPAAYGYEPGNVSGEYHPAGNYFIEADSAAVSVRGNDGSTEWTTVADSTRDFYVDTKYFRFYTDGSHRKHFTIRFRLMHDAAGAEWLMNGYAVDAEGNLPHDQAYTTQEGWFLTVTEGPAGVNEDMAVPERFFVASISPNPFNPSTTITVSVPSSGEVALSVYDAAGRKVRELARGNYTTGVHRFVWDGRDGRGAAVAAGVYLVRADMGDVSATGKMLLLK